MTIKTILNYSMSVAILAATLSLNSCKKEEDDHGHDDSSDKDKPVIAMTSPTAMQVFYSGDTVRIKGVVTDESLHEMMIKIIKDSDGSVLFTETPTVHDLKIYNINTYWKSQVSDHTNARLIVLAEDHNANVSSDTVRIHIMP